jgi:hypothetical protein
VQFNQNYQNFDRQNYENFSGFNTGYGEPVRKCSYGGEENMNYGFVSGFCVPGNNGVLSNGSTQGSTKGSIKGFSASGKSEFQLSAPSYGSSDDDAYDSGREMTLLSDLLKDCEVHEDEEDVEREDVGCGSDLKVQKMLDCLDM